MSGDEWRDANRANWDERAAAVVLAAGVAAARGGQENLIQVSSCLL
jgi:hypothetical protein